MDLRPRRRQPFSGFTKAEVLKMEQLITDSKEECLDEEFSKKLARLFNRSNDRAGKPAVKWTEIQSWFQKNRDKCYIKETSSEASASKKEPVNVLEAVTQSTENGTSKVTGDKDVELPKVEFEAKSGKDGAWYDVDTFLSHRFLDSGDIEVRVRYVGFGVDEDEWVNCKDALRERSIPLENKECKRVMPGDPVVCFQERQDQARYYDAHVVEVQRRLHDIRGCRCFFLIKYDHDNSEEKVRLRRLCYRPDSQPEEAKP